MSVDDLVVFDLMKLGQRVFLFAAPRHGMDFLFKIEPRLLGGARRFKGLSQKRSATSIWSADGEIIAFTGQFDYPFKPGMKEWWERIAWDFFMIPPPLTQANIIDTIDAGSGQWLLHEDQLRAALPRFETFDEDISEIIGYYHPRFELVSSREVELDGRQFLACAIVDETHNNSGWDWAPLGAPRMRKGARSEHAYVFYDFLLPWSEHEDHNARALVEAQQFVRILPSETRLDWFTRMHELFTVRSCGEILNPAD